ncbi:MULTISPECIES: hypothetical protein [Paenibacillus]|uniref:hypothetical protein n=1 Tax=Paenibacillus TaxID=44249 RepID=UPI00096DCD36|nr:hypothetical protein [Paenibacillus odorifer]OME27168.1 hypothetical protein BSK57_05500 [Paenibacillus odorifer]
MKKITRGGLEATIRENQLKAADKLAEQQVLNQQDKVSMDEIKQKYLAAVTSGDTASIDALNEQLKGISQRIHDRNIVIEALSVKGNPAMQQIISDAVNSWAVERDNLVTHAEELYRELQPHHIALVEGLAKLNGLRQNVIGLEGNIRDYNDQLTEDKKMPLTDLSHKIAAQFMNTLFIQQYVKR